MNVYACPGFEPSIKNNLKHVFTVFPNFTICIPQPWESFDTFQKGKKEMFDEFR